ncbi:MAG: hypothetical protein JWM99_2255 [Verrucomicrobiales bacterium]|nr:hypothetical protein [Verrucomicrobiales bacterium]
MPLVENPAITALVSIFDSELVIAQVLVRKVVTGFDLVHVADQELVPGKLLRLTREELRRWVQRTEAAVFRPLKSSPSLAPGWTYHCADIDALYDALLIIYPGFVPDWYAASSGQPPVTDYREYTSRQTGMYRITQMLSDSQAADVILAVCDARFCLKRRLWSVAGLDSDVAASKSVIPCLEPCAILLEYARKSMRIEQEEKIALSLAPSELASIQAVIKEATEGKSPPSSEADASDPSNRRRLQLLLVKLKKNESPSISKE